MRDYPFPSSPQFFVQSSSHLLIFALLSSYRIHQYDLAQERQIVGYIGWTSGNFILDLLYWVTVCCLNLAIILYLLIIAHQWRKTNFLLLITSFFFCINITYLFIFFGNLTVCLAYKKIGKKRKGEPWHIVLAWVSNDTF